MQNTISTSENNPLFLMSKFRTHLMGVAILWIMLFHASVFNHLMFPLNFLIYVGYAGVDIFIFLSGFGLYFASLKKESKARFYYNRFTRILPAYFIIVLIRWMTKDFTFTYLLAELSTLNFWILKRSTFWYIPAICALYLIFPFYIKQFNKKPLLATILSILAGLVLSFCLVSLEMHPLHITFAFRIPLFFLGIYFGYLLKQGVVMKAWQKYLLYLLSIIGWLVLYDLIEHKQYLLNSGGFWLPFLVIIPGSLLFLSVMLNYLTRIKILDKTLIFIGSLSLELYLIHFFLLDFKGMGTMDSRIFTFLLLLGSIPLSYLLSVICKRITGILDKYILVRLA